MSDQTFATAFTVDKTPEEAFDAITDVRSPSLTEWVLVERRPTLMEDTDSRQEPLRHEPVATACPLALDVHDDGHRPVTGLAAGVTSNVGLGHPVAPLMALARALCGLYGCLFCNSPLEESRFDSLTTATTEVA